MPLGRVYMRKSADDVPTIPYNIRKPAYVILNNQNLPIRLASSAFGNFPLCSRPAGLVLQAHPGSNAPPDQRNCADGLADAISRFPRLAA
jgi:hypothetical protein